MEKSQIYTTIDTSILIEVMLNELNREGYINNETYLSAKSELKKESDINVDIIIQSVTEPGKKDISFTVSRDQMDEAVKVLEENHARIKAQKIEADPTVAKLSIVGAGMQTHPGVAAGMFEALYNIGVNIRMIGTSEIRVTVLVDEKDVDKAMRAAHDRFIED